MLAPSSSPSPSLPSPSSSSPIKNPPPQPPSRLQVLLFVGMNTIMYFSLTAPWSKGRKAVIKDVRQRTRFFIPMVVALTAIDFLASSKNNVQGANLSQEKTISNVQVDDFLQKTISNVQVDDFPQKTISNVQVDDFLQKPTPAIEDIRIPIIEDDSFQARLIAIEKYKRQQQQQQQDQNS